MSKVQTIQAGYRLIALAFFALAGLMTLWAAASPAAAGGGCRGEPVTSGDTTLVQIGEAPCFTPTILRAHPGDSVTWTNEGSLPHTVTGANASWGDYSELLNGQSVAHTFDAAGSYSYYCLLHPGMVGAVIVTDDERTSRAESASLNGSSVDGSSVAEPAAVDVTGDSDSVRNAVAVAAAVAGVVLAGGGGFALGRRGWS